MSLIPFFCVLAMKERESLSFEKLEILLSYYGAGDDAPVKP